MNNMEKHVAASVQYIPLQIPIDYAPDLTVCDDTVETLFYVCTRSYTDDEFAYLQSIIRMIHDRIDPHSPCVLINDIDTNKHYRRTVDALPVNEHRIMYERSLPNFRKVVNGYDKKEMWVDQGYDRIEYHSSYVLDKYHVEDEKEEKKEKGRKIMVTAGSRNLYNGFSLFPYDYFYNDRKFSSQLRHVWWFDYFLRVPCARGRLMQFSGICWFNVILNVFILSPIAAIMKREITYSPEFEQYYKNNGGPKKLFSYTNPPFVKQLIDMSFIRSSFAEKIEQLLSMPELAIPLRALLYGLLHNLIDLDEKVLTTISKLVNPSESDEYVGYLWLQGISYYMRGSFIFPNGTWLPSPLSTTISFLGIQNDHYRYDTGDYVTFITSCLQESSVKKNGASLVVIDLNACYMGLTPLPISFGEYLLAGAGLLTNDGLHIISGLICEAVPYVYDSNNCLAKSDWVNSDMTGYMKRMIEIEGRVLYFVNRFANVIYVKNAPSPLGKKSKKRGARYKKRRNTKKR
jgi:hypothetical protein